jgi:FkbM family methyltransferase
VGTVLDVGAHSGGFARLLRGPADYQGRIISFEPASATFEELTAAMGADPLWEGHQLALGSSTGSLELHVLDSTDFNSLRPVNDFALDRFARSVAGQASERVEVRRLDEVVRPRGPTLLKSDTQGYDREVLEGAAGLLDHVVGVVVELSVRPIYEGAPDLIEMLGLLHERGFELCGLYPISRDVDRLRVIEFDGVFTRR